MGEEKIHVQETNDNKKKIERATIILFLVGLALALFNQVQIFQLTSLQPNSGTDIIPTGLAVAEASEVIPSGIPDLYGKELGVRYGDVTPDNPELADQTIQVLGNLDRTINLEGENLDRYIDITSQISCEYCCGAQSIIVRREDAVNMDIKIEEAIAAGKITREQAENYRVKAGSAACGCAHSYAMRGLSKYLVLNYGNQISDEQILEELGKWKTLFFPSQMSAKALVLKEKGIEFNYVNLASNKYRGIEKGSAGGSGMVGGC